MGIVINKSDVDTIKLHGERDYPFECCGFLLGKTEGEAKQIVISKPVENSRETENRHNRYLIPPQDYMKMERLARSKGLEIVGFYHSHPDAEARPSQYDLDHSWPFYSYIIVSVKKNKAEQMTSWQLKEDRSEFLKEDIIETEEN